MIAHPFNSGMHVFILLKRLHRRGLKPYLQGDKLYQQFTDRER